MLNFLSSDLHTWRLMHFSSNRRVRCSDRVETHLRCAHNNRRVLTPLSLMVGSETHAATRQAVLHEQRTRSLVTATVLEAPQQMGQIAKASWTLPKRRGSDRWHRVEADRRGGTTAVDLGRPSWIGDTKPRSAGVAVVQGIAAVVAATGGIVRLWALTAAGIRRVVDNHRLNAWQTEWASKSVDSHP